MAMQQKGREKGAFYLSDASRNGLQTPTPARSKKRRSRSADPYARKRRVAFDMPGMSSYSSVGYVDAADIYTQRESSSLESDQQHPLAAASAEMSTMQDWHQPAAQSTCVGKSDGLGQSSRVQVELGHHPSPVTGDGSCLQLDKEPLTTWSAFPFNYKNYCIRKIWDCRGN